MEREVRRGKSRDLKLDHIHPRGDTLDANGFKWVRTENLKPRCGTTTKGKKKKDMSLCRKTKRERET